MINPAYSSRRPRPAGGFSTIELALTLVVILVVAAIAFPSFLNAYHIYQLSDASSQLAGILEATRFEAIRRNTPVTCIIQQAGGAPPTTKIWTDSNANAAWDPGERQIIFSGAVNLVDAGSVPGTGNLTASVSVPTLTTVPLSNGTLKFDQRGAGDPNSVYALYITNTSFRDAGYRGVVLFPSGSIQIWQADAQGRWRFLR